jgi:hypothetical protein
MRAPFIVVFIVLSLASALCTPLLAEEKSFTAEHVYILGDNDTKNEARSMAVLLAKRKLLEKAGTFLTVNTDIENYALTQDAVRSSAAAVLQVEDVQEEYFVQNASFAVRVFVTARVDASAAEEKARRFAENKSLGEAPSSFARRQALEEDILHLDRRQRGLSGDKLFAAKEQRRRLFMDLESLQVEQALILDDLERSTQAVQELVRYGMSADEVAAVAGEPRFVKSLITSSKTYDCRRFGRLWVVFEDGAAMCVRSSLSYSKRLDGDCHCAGFASAVKQLR